MYLLGLSKIILVRVVESLLLPLGHLQMAADLVANDLLGENPVPDIGLEILEGNPLLPGSLFQVLHGVHVVLLADLVETADHFGVGIQAELLGPGEEELLVDHVAQKILLTVGGLLRIYLILLIFASELLLASLHIAAADDPVVHPGNDVFHHGSVRRNCRRRGQGYLLLRLIGD